MSTDNPTQLLTTHDLSQFRGQLQTAAAAATTATAVVAAAAAAVHGYRSIAPSTVANSVNTTTSNHSNHSHNNGNMPASSKYIFVQHNGNFTTYDAAAVVPVSSGAASVVNSSNGSSTTGNAGGNIVLLAAEPLELGTGEAIAAATAAGLRGPDDDGELRPLAWLNDTNLIKGIVTGSGATPNLKRGATVSLTAGALKAATPINTGNGNNICIVSDIIEELPSVGGAGTVLSSSEQVALYADEHKVPSTGTSAVYSTTTVHKGPSGTTTVVEYKATKAAGTAATCASSTSSGATYLTATVRNTNANQLSHSYVPVSGAGTAPLVVVAASSSSSNNTNTKPQIYVSSNGANASGVYKAAVVAGSNTTTHHPHKKYLREKMNVHVEHSGHVASTVTVVSSPASSNNSSLSSCSASGSSTAAVNGGNSPVPKSSFNTVFDAVNYSNNAATAVPAATTTTSIETTASIQHTQTGSNIATTTAALLGAAAASLPAGYSFVSHLGGTPHVITNSSVNLQADTPNSTLLPPGATYYSTAAALQSHSLQLSITPPPPAHNNIGSGSGSGGSNITNNNSGMSNIRSPISYSSYDNDDSLKEFELGANSSSSRMLTSTPQFGMQQQQQQHQQTQQLLAKSTAGGTAGYINANNNNNNNNNNNTPQKQKHPNNVPYDPLVHTNNKPPYSFSSLIFMAIEGSIEKALPVKEIYAWIVQHFPYFTTAPTGWKNSVRHNLSLNKSFVKVEKAPNMGKGSLWRVEPQQRQNLIQALNRSPFFPNSAVDKISTLKSPGSAGYDTLDGGGSSYGGSVSGAPIMTAKSNGLSNNSNTSNITGTLVSVAGNASTAANAATAATGSHERFDPKLYPNLSKAFAGAQQDDELPSDFSASGYHNNNNNNNSKYNYANLNGHGSGNGNGNASGVPTGNGPYNFERLARDCGADSMDDVHAAAAMLFLKHGPKAFTESFQNGAPVITSSPSEDHTYSAGGNSNADSGASTPLTNGNGSGSLVMQQNTNLSSGNGNGINCGAGADSNCASSDAAYDSSEENHNVTPEELADQQRHRDGVDALLSLSRSSIVECGSTATTHYHSNGSSMGSSQGSPHKRASSRSIEEEHEAQQLNGNAIYTNGGNGSKMALLSSAAANVQGVAPLQQRASFEELYGTAAVGSGAVPTSNYYGLAAGSMLTAAQSHHLQQQHLSAAMVNAVAANVKRVKPLRGLRTKIKRKSAWMR